MLFVVVMYSVPAVAAIFWLAISSAVERKIPAKRFIWTVKSGVSVFVQESKGWNRHRFLYTWLLKKNFKRPPKTLLCEEYGVVVVVAAVLVCQGTFGHSRHSSLSHCGLILAWRAELMCASKKKSAGGEWVVIIIIIIIDGFCMAKIFPSKKTQCASTHHSRKYTHRHKHNLHTRTHHDPPRFVEMPLRQESFELGWSHTLPKSSQGRKNPPPSPLAFYFTLYGGQKILALTVNKTQWQSEWPLELNIEVANIIVLGFGVCKR